MTWVWTFLFIFIAYVIIACVIIGGVVLGGAAIWHRWEKGRWPWMRF